jgi:hypothetical protein
VQMATTVTTSSEFDPYRPEERDAIRQREGAKARSDGLMERLRTLSHRLAHETESGRRNPTGHVVYQERDLQSERERERKLRAYRTRWLGVETGLE